MGQVDQSSDGFIDYEDFLQKFSQVEGKHDVGKDDRLSDDEIFYSVLSASMNIAEAFQRMDEKKDGILSADDLQKGRLSSACVALAVDHARAGVLAGAGAVL
jgi:Ca2+-binding EF-hand superfamily protein